MKTISNTKHHQFKSLGTKAMKTISNTKHHQFKILYLQMVFQVVLVIWS
jgi:hypothetical protein